MSWEDFERAARREFEGQVSYVVDGDVPISHEELRALYDEAADLKTGLNESRENLVVNTNNGVDDIWNEDQKRDLTYCVNNDFGANKARVISEMRSATRSWEEVADVRFRYVPAEDGSCTNSNHNIVFSVRPWTDPGACSFSPSGTGEVCRQRTLVINIPDIDDPSFPNITTTGVFRHELGHILGLRHEHIRLNLNGCLPTNANWRPVTAYDKFSVMHFPGCAGDPNTSFSLTALDAQGIRSLYGARHRVGTSGKIANVSRIERHMESLWVAPNGSVQGAWWYAEAGTWSRYQLAAASAASPTGGIALTSRIPTHMEALWIAPNGSVQGAFWYSGSAWQLYQLAPAGSASVNGSISLVSRTSTTLDAAWIGADGSVQGAFWESGAFPWTRYTIAGAGSAALDANPLLISRLPRHMEAFWISPSGVMGGSWWYETNPGERLWSPRYSLAAGATTGAGISGIARTHDRMDVFWIGSGGSVETAKWQEGSAWQTSQLDAFASATGGVTALSLSPDNIETFWTRNDGGVSGAAWTGNQWGPHFSFSVAGSSSLRATFGSCSRSRSHMELLWQGPDGSLEESTWQSPFWSRRQVAPAGNVTTSQ